jgi:hypothetical protein
MIYRESLAWEKTFKIILSRTVHFSGEFYMICSVLTRAFGNTGVLLAALWLFFFFFNQLFLSGDQSVGKQLLVSL